MPDLTLTTPSGARVVSVVGYVPTRHPAADALAQVVVERRDGAQHHELLPVASLAISRENWVHDVLAEQRPATVSALLALAQLVEQADAGRIGGVA